MSIIEKNITVTQFLGSAASATAAQIAAEAAQGLSEAARDTAVTARNQLQPILTDLARILAVSDDLTEINAVHAKLTEINAVYAALANINIVAGDTVAINALATNIAALLALNTDLAKLITLHGSLANLNALHASLSNLNAVHGSLTNLNTLHTNLAALLNVNTNTASILQAAVDAVAAKNKAEEWSEKGENIPVEIGQFSAKHHAIKAQASNVAAQSVVDTEIPALLGNFFDPAIIALSSRIEANSATVIRKLRFIQDELITLASAGIQPSLAMLPSAFYIGKILSVLPDDGTGDMVVARASTVTVTNKDGDPEIVPIDTPAIDWATGSPLLVVSADDTITFPSTGLDAVKTMVFGDTAYIHTESYEYNSYVLQTGSYSKILASNNILTEAQLTALGVTTIYEDAWILPISGNPLAPATPTEGTIVFSATDDLTVVATGDAVIVSTTMAADATFRSHTVVITCPNGGSGSIVVSQPDKIVSFGNHRGTNSPTTNFYTGTDASAPVLTWNLNEIPTNVVRIRQATQFITILPATGNKAFPTGLTYLVLIGGNIAYTYTGAPPAGLTFIQIIAVAGFQWTWSGAFPVGITNIDLRGSGINWTGTTIGNTGTPKTNMITIALIDFRTTAMDYEDLFLILDSFRDNVGTMPVLVNLYEQIAANVTAIAAATGNETGTDAEKARFKINTLKTSKSIATFNLNTTAI